MINGSGGDSVPVLTTNWEAFLSLSPRGFGQVKNYTEWMVRVLSRSYQRRLNYPFIYFVFT